MRGGGQGLCLAGCSGCSCQGWRRLAWAPLAPQPTTLRCVCVLGGSSAQIPPPLQHTRALRSRSALAWRAQRSVDGADEEHILDRNSRLTTRRRGRGQHRRSWRLGLQIATANARRTTTLLCPAVRAHQRRRRPPGLRLTAALCSRGPPPPRTGAVGDASDQDQNVDHGQELCNDRVHVRRVRVLDCRRACRSHAPAPATPPACG